MSTEAARKLADTTKSVPQMRGISSRWLVRMLPWVEVSGGTYRVNRRLTYVVGDGRVTFDNVGPRVRVIPRELGELRVLRDFQDEAVLGALADRFSRHEYSAGDVIVEFGHEADQLFLIVHGKVGAVSAGAYESRSVVGTLAGGDYFGDHILTQSNSLWEYTVTALTACTVLTLPARAFREVMAGSDALREHVARYVAREGLPRNRKGEADIAVASGHVGEPELPGTFVDYETSPREYELSVAQTVLRVHSRVADLYSEPMDQTGQQIRLTVEALRERQEHELLNNREFGLLHNADLSQRIHTRSGPPTPDDLDALLCMRRKTKLYLAHPKAIAAFGRECSRRGLYPDNVEVDGRQVAGWRGVPILPCDKVPVAGNTTSILAMRIGEDDEGVVGLRQTGRDDEYEPGLDVRHMGVDAQAVSSYLVTAYHSAAVLVPDALGVLDNVEISRS